MYNLSGSMANPFALILCLAGNIKITFGESQRERERERESGSLRVKSAKSCIQISVKLLIDFKD